MEIEGINDEKFEALLDSLRVAEPEILCNSGNKIVRICANPICKVALQCAEPFCEDCGVNIHQMCPSFPLVAITKILNSRADKYKEFISKVLEMDRELINAVQESKKELTSQYKVASLSPESQRIVDEIYKKKSSKSLSGLEGQ
jgi:hypothetical protein